MTSKTQFLQRLGHSWYVRVKVPRESQAAIGNTHFRKARGTRDLDHFVFCRDSQVATRKTVMEPAGSPRAARGGPFSVLASTSRRSG